MRGTQVRRAEEAEWGELVAIDRRHYEQIGGWILEVDGERKGWVFASRILGVVWLTDLEVHGPDKMATALLILKAKRELLAMGHSTVTVMVDMDSKMQQLYKEHGFKEHGVVMTGRLK